MLKTTRIKKALSVLTIGAMALAVLTACSNKTVKIMVTEGSTGKVTANGAIEHRGHYFIWDKNGINYKDNIEDEGFVIADTDDTKGDIQDNFAVTENHLFFKAIDDDLCALYRTNLKGQMRQKIYECDVINIVGVHSDNVYITDEEDTLRCISSSTGEEVDITLVKGTQFVQRNNYIFYKNENDNLRAYNCDTNILESETLGENVDNIIASDKGIAYVSNKSKKESEYKLTTMSMSVAGGTFSSMSTIQPNQKLSLTTDYFSFINKQDSLIIYNNKDGSMVEEKQPEQGKLIYNYATSDSAYYVNEDICWEFSSESFEKQPISVNFTDEKIDYDKIFAIADGYVFYFNDKGQYRTYKIK